MYVVVTLSRKYNKESVLLYMQARPTEHGERKRPESVQMTATLSHMIGKQGSNLKPEAQYMPKPDTWVSLPPPQIVS